VIKYKKEKITFDDVLNKLKNNNINVYFKELTTDDIKDTGIKVVKVIAPSLIDLNKSHIYPRLGAKRFFEVPKKLGLNYSENLTMWPHPFP
jgi:ribosomal protein S12 methylthiotransferase accessory factor